MYYSDYHLHTNFSSDGRSSMEDMIKRAIELELKDICFTDHYDYDNPYINPDTLIDYHNYTKVYEKLKEKYADQISIKLGIEIGLQPQILKKMEDFIKDYPFDFIIGSTHTVERIDLGGIDGSKFFEQKGKKAAYKIYFEDMLNNVKNSDAFDVYGHLDYVIRYGGYETKSFSYSDFSDVLDEILKTIIHRGKGIEINTSGYRYGLGQAHPSNEVIRRYRELGGEIITVGSDGHSVDHICSGFDMAYKLLLEEGFSYICTYDKRVPKFVPIR